MAYTIGSCIAHTLHAAIGLDKATTNLTHNARRGYFSKSFSIFTLGAFQELHRTLSTFQTRRPGYKTHSTASPNPLTPKKNKTQDSTQGKHLILDNNGELQGEDELPLPDRRPGNRRLPAQDGFRRSRRGVRRFGHLGRGRVRLVRVRSSASVAWDKDQDDEEEEGGCRGIELLPEGNDGGGRKPSSLPVNVPDWSKILREEYKENRRNTDFNDEGGEEDEGEEEEGEGEGEGKGRWLPPHEFLLARTRTSSFSVHEGIGRTLKGRDLSRVRNAIWAKIGFLD
ncbi:hypothetical protein Dimus_009851 [Dionaea muscipula]